MGWRVYKRVGNDEVEVEGIIDQNGKANFPANLSDNEVKYRVTYDTNNGSSCEITVTQAGNSCAFDYTPAEGNIPEGGGNFTFGTLSDVGESTTITVEVKRGAEYLTGGVINKSGNNLVGTVSENDNGTRTIEYIIKSNGNECERYTVYQPGNTCKCTCRDTTVEKNENGEPFYYYTLSDTYSKIDDTGFTLNHVPFLIVTTSQSFDCPITATAIDSGIERIYCELYDASEWTSNFLYTKFRARCQSLLSTGKKVYIIYGDISEATASRALGFTYQVCDDTCKNKDGEEPFYVFQRCACGMDNCRNEYQAAAGLIIEDRPLYKKGCTNELDWSHADSICVEQLSIESVRYYTLTYPGNVKGDETVISKSQLAAMNNLQESDLWLRDGSNGAVAGTLNSHFSRNFNEYYTERPAPGTERLLLVHGTATNPKFRLYTLYTGTESCDYNCDTVECRGTCCYPLQTMVQYIVDAEPIEGKEQVWELTFSTTSDFIIGGCDDHGKCALPTFVCTMYKAPRGMEYDVERDIHNKRGIKNC